MKRLMCLLLMFVMLILTSCESKKETIACHDCGKEISASSAFCEHCGVSVKKDVTDSTETSTTNLNDEKETEKTTEAETTTKPYTEKNTKPYTKPSTQVITEDSNRVPGVSIGRVYVQLDSAAGAEPFISWKNDSGKVIKYITFTAVPYNAVGDIVSSTIGNETYVDLKITGPFGPAGEDFAERGNSYIVNGKKYTCNCQPEDGKNIYYWDDDYNEIPLPESEYKNIYRSSSWEPVWYNSTIRKVVVTKVYVEYMDGSTETIKNPPIKIFDFYSKYYG